MRLSVQVLVILLATALAAVVLPTPPADAEGVANRVVVNTPTGLYSSLALDASGHPVIAHTGGGGDSLKVSVCADQPCANATTRVVVGGGTERLPSLVLNASGHPMISHADAAADRLNLTACHDRTCASRTTVAVIDTDNWLGRHSSLALNAQGNPVIAYHEENNSQLKLAMCANRLCSSVATSVVANVPGRSILSPSLVLDPSGNPVISYVSSGADGRDDVMLAVCRDTRCTRVSISRIDNSGSGYSPSLAVNRAGSATVSFHTRAGDLKVAVCQNRLCTDRSTAVLETRFAAGDNSSLVLDPAGNRSSRTTNHSGISWLPNAPMRCVRP